MVTPLSMYTYYVMYITDVVEWYHLYLPTNYLLYTYIYNVIYECLQCLYYILLYLQKGKKALYPHMKLFPLQNLGQNNLESSRK